jgi:hypothetical protein
MSPEKRRFKSGFLPYQLFNPPTIRLYIYYYKGEYSLLPSRIERYFGMDRIKARAPEWLAAMREGKRATPKCTATTRTGHPCGNEPLRGASLCRHHLKGSARVAYDTWRLPQWQKQAQKSNVQWREKATQSLRRIERFNLRRAWFVDPRLPGSTLALTEHDETRVRRWLWDEHQINLCGLSPAGEIWTPRAVDRLRWAAFLALNGSATPNKADRRVLDALRRELKLFAKLHQIEADQLPVCPGTPICCERATPVSSTA